MWRVDSLEKTLMLGGIGGWRRRGRQRMRWLDGITNLMGMSLSDELVIGRPGVLRFMGLQRVGHDWVTDWTELNWLNWTERNNHKLWTVYMLLQYSEQTKTLGIKLRSPRRKYPHELEASGVISNLSSNWYIEGIATGQTKWSCRSERGCGV